MGAKLLQSCLTLCTPMDCSLQAPLSMVFCRQESWRGLPCPSPGDLLDPGIETVSYISLHCQADSLPLAPPGKASIIYTLHFAFDRSGLNTQGFSSAGFSKQGRRTQGSGTRGKLSYPEIYHKDCLIFS